MVVYCVFSETRHNYNAELEHICLELRTAVQLQRELQENNNSQYSDADYFIEAREVEEG